MKRKERAKFQVGERDWWVQVLGEGKAGSRSDQVRQDASCRYRQVLGAVRRRMRLAHRYFASLPENGMCGLEAHYSVRREMPRGEKKNYNEKSIGSES